MALYFLVILKFKFKVNNNREQYNANTIWSMNTQQQIPAINLSYKASKQFYTELGDELCNMKDSPFYRIGELPKIQDKKSLDFNPSRFFKPQAEDIEFVDDTYKKFLEQEKQQEELFKIDYDILKKDTAKTYQEYQKQLQKMEQLRRFEHKEPYTWFGVYRGACLLCGMCGEYEGCFGVSQRFSMSPQGFAENAYNQSEKSGIELMQCFKCKCPMNSHVALPSNPTMHSQIFNNLIKKSITDNYLKCPHIVLCFKLPESNLQSHHLILQFLVRLNCAPINFKCLSKLNFELSLIKSNIIQNGNTEKAYIEALINFIESIKLQKQWKWGDGTGYGGRGRQSRDDITEPYEQLYDTINKIGMRIDSEMGISYKQCAFVVLCRYDAENARDLIRYLSRKHRVTPDVVDRTVLTNSTAASSLSSQRNSFSSRAYGSQAEQTDAEMLFQTHKIAFIYGTSQHKQSLILSQYFFKQNYELSYSIFMLPGGQLSYGINNNKNLLSHINNNSNSNVEVDVNQNQAVRRQYEWNDARFKDVLDYNRYIVFLENVRQVDRVKFQQVMTKVAGFRSSKIDYIMGQELLNDKIKKLSIKLCVKLGNQSLALPFPSVPDFITIKNTAPKHSQIPKILSVLYPQFSYSQRCILIIRPFLMTSNFEQVIVNLLRINRFILLKRIHIKMSQSEAKYMSTLENIKEDGVDDYIKYMTAGVCEIILVSKRAAIYQAYALANGCLNGPSDIITKPLKTTKPQSSSITIQHKKNRQIYETELPLYMHNYESQNISFPFPSNQPFKSIRELIDIEKILFGHNVQAQFATNVRNGEIIRIQPGASTGNTAVGSGQAAVQPFSYKVKQSLLKELKKDNFNFWVFTSKSQMLTEQLAGIFLPECTLFQPITVLIKPGLIHLVPLIKNALSQLKYHIIAQKQLQMNRSAAIQFINNIQKIRLPSQTLKYIIDTYTRQRVYILCLSKIAGRRQIMSMLSGFSFLTALPTNSPYLRVNGTDRSATSIDNKIGSSKQAEGLFVEDEYISDQMLCDMLVPVWNNEELCLRAISEPLANLEQSIRGLCQNGFYDENAAHALSKVHQFHVLNYIVGSFFGVPLLDLSLSTRLGKLCILILQNLQTARLQSWYYAQISNIKPNYVPLLFQYRQIGQTIVCVQSDRGVEFMDKVIHLYSEEQEKIKATKQRNQADFSLRPTNKKNQRRSLVLFLFSKKLAELCLELSQITTQLKDFGEIVHKNGQFRGVDTLEQAQSQQFLFLTRLQSEYQSHREIKQNLRKLTQSRHQKQRFLPKNKRLLPSFELSPLSQCLRVLQKTETSKLNLMDKYAFVDPNHEAAKEKDLYSVHLFNVLPEIRTKYAMIAQIYYFFVKAEFDNGDASQMIGQIEAIFSDIITDVQDLEVVQYEIYLRFLIEFVRMPAEIEFKSVLFGILKSYPNLRKDKRIDRDDVAGKKRKFIQNNHYFKRSNQQSKEVKQIIENKYTDFDLNKLRDEQKATTIYNPKDPFHYRLANVENRVNLLRETKQDQQRNGVYVQFQKNISEKQQLLKEKIMKEAERFKFRHEEQILHETGLEKDIWYRRTKGEQREKPETKTNKAIQKQIERFMSFKEEEKKKISQKRLE